MSINTIHVNGSQEYIEKIEDAISHFEEFHQSVVGLMFPDERKSFFSFGLAYTISTDQKVGLLCIGSLLLLPSALNT